MGLHRGNAMLLPTRNSLPARSDLVEESYKKLSDFISKISGKKSEVTHGEYRKDSFVLPFTEKGFLFSEEQTKDLIKFFSQKLQSLRIQTRSGQAYTTNVKFALTKQSESISNEYFDISELDKKLGAEKLAINYVKGEAKKPDIDSIVDLKDPESLDDATKKQRGRKKKED